MNELMPPAPTKRAVSVAVENGFVVLRQGTQVVRVDRATAKMLHGMLQPFLERQNG